VFFVLALRVVREVKNHGSKEKETLLRKNNPGYLWQPGSFKLLFAY
jgi:hypothetical protein